MNYKRYRHATSTVELVVVSSLIIVAAITGFSTLGQSVLLATEKLAFHEPGSGRTSVTKTAEAPKPTPGQAPQTSPAPNSLAYFQVIFASLLLLVVLVVSLRPKTKPARVLDDPDPVQSRTKADDLRQTLFLKRQEMLKRFIAASTQDRLGQLTVSDVMSTRLIPVAPTMKVEELVRIFREQHRHHLLVCDDQGHLLGIISDRDLAHRQGRTAADLMTTKVSTAGPDTDLMVAVTAMINQGISALPVMEEEKLVGIITTRDLMLAVQCLIQLHANELEAAV